MLLLSLCAMALMPLSASAATATASAKKHHKAHFFLHKGKHKTIQAASGNNLNYNGGPVMGGRHDQRVRYLLGAERRRIFELQQSDFALLQRCGRYRPLQQQQPVYRLRWQCAWQHRAGGFVGGHGRLSRKPLARLGHPERSEPRAECQRLVIEYR
jgi:hypothetical protein